MQSTKTGATSTYQYDHGNMRVRLMTGTSTTVTATPTYSTEGGVAVKHLMVNGELLATIRGSGSSSVVHTVETDHLGSPEKTVNASGTIVELSDYYPYGSPRQDTGSLDDRKGYLAKDYDADTGLTQAEARYYKGGIGRFVSQDPTFLALGDQNRILQLTGLTQDAILSNPQTLNSYSYAGNNPITFKDPDGKFVPLLVAGIYFAMSYYGYATYVNELQDAYIKNQHPDVFSQDQIRQAQNKVAVDGIITAATTGAGIVGMQVAGRVVDTITTVGSLADSFFNKGNSNDAGDDNKKKKTQNDSGQQSRVSNGPGGSMISPSYNSSGANLQMNNANNGASYQQQLNNLYAQFNGLLQAYQSYVSGLPASPASPKTNKK